MFLSGKCSQPRSHLAPSWAQWLSPGFEAWWLVFVVNLTVSGLTKTPKWRGTPVRDVCLIWRCTSNQDLWEGKTGLLPRSLELDDPPLIWATPSAWSPSKDTRKGKFALGLLAFASVASPFLHWQESLLLWDYSISEDQLRCPALWTAEPIGFLTLLFLGSHC